MKELKKQFMAAIAMTLVAAIALGSSTYAWFANNKSVHAEGMEVTAKSDLGYMLISAGKKTVAEVQADEKTTVSAASPSAALYPTAHETITKISDADTIANWYYKEADSAKKSESTKSKNTIEDFESYVLINEFSICTAAGSNNLSGLKVSSISVRQSGAEAVKVIVASDTACEEFGCGENQWSNEKVTSSQS